VNVKIEWISIDDVSKETVETFLKHANGLIVPGGCGSSGIEGAVTAIGYARRENIPFLGICLGLQAAVIEFARNVVGLPNANSIEFDAGTEDPVISSLWSKSIGGNVRKGAFACTLEADSRVRELYGDREVSERHRHRYAVNDRYREALKDAGMRMSGVSTEGEIVEMIELGEHPFFVASQAHPEFKSRPNRAHPLFKGFVEAAYSFVK
jgi:CTP synthase